MIKNNTNNNQIIEETKEQRLYNLDTYTLINKLQEFESKYQQIKVTLKDKFPYQINISSVEDLSKKILTIIYDQKDFFEQEIIPEIITRYSINTTIKDSYYEDKNYIAIMENNTILELKDFEEKIINKLVGYIEKIQKDLQFSDAFEYKLKVEEEKENLMVLQTPAGTSNVLLITLILLALVASAIIIVILLKIA